ncbi:MAG: class I SAM-dependent methyltransferase [Deltaproteobacteria bacterium]|nr:class I SAM-dependent methyltransferase [Deltaproteobacteria bacterium]
MPRNTRWEERYKTGSVPWDIGKPDSNLIEIVTKRPIRSCKALDIGCGTGDDAVWLAQHGFEVTGNDVSKSAIEVATKKASQAGVECTFHVIDFPESQVPGAPFGFVFDRGCHTICCMCSQSASNCDPGANLTIPLGIVYSFPNNHDKLSSKIRNFNGRFPWDRQRLHAPYQGCTGEWGLLYLSDNWRMI